MTMCESDRGEWGQPCPDCGVTLPSRRSLRSWKAAREIDEELSAQARLNGSDEFNKGLHRPQKAQPTRRIVDRNLILDIYERTGGNIKSTARQLGIYPGSVRWALKRGRDAA